jgi:hypothetical protein
MFHHSNTVLSALYITIKTAVLPVLPYLFCLRHRGAAEIRRCEGELFSSQAHFEMPSLS